MKWVGIMAIVMFWLTVLAIPIYPQLTPEQKKERLLVEQESKMSEQELEQHLTTEPEKGKQREVEQQVSAKEDLRKQLEEAEVNMKKYGPWYWTPEKLAAEMWKEREANTEQEEQTLTTETNKTGFEQWEAIGKITRVLPWEKEAPFGTVLTKELFIESVIIYIKQYTESGYETNPFIRMFVDALEKQFREYLETGPK